MTNRICEKEAGFLTAILEPIAALLVRPVISSAVKGISGRGIRRARGRYIDQIFSSTPSLKQYQDYQVFQLWA